MVDNCSGNDFKKSGCSRGSFFEFIRMNLSDCDKPYAWADSHIDTAINMAMAQVVRSNKDEFSKVKEITLENGECIQSACDCCEGVIELVGNVNGKCDIPKKDVSDNDKWLNKMYQTNCGVSDKKENYEIESIDILGDGGCQFRVLPQVPLDGVYKIKILCTEYPDINGEIPISICRHMNEVLYLALGMLHMKEDDRDVLNEKADRWFNLYFKIIELENNKDRDVFIKSIRYGTRVDESNE